MTLTRLRPLAERLYVPLLVCLGVVALRPWALHQSTDLADLAILTALFTLSEVFVIRFRGGATNLSFPMAFAAFILYGSLSAVWVACAGIVVANLIRRRPLRAVMINVSLYAVGAGLAGWAVEALLGLGTARPLWQELVALLIFSQVYFWTIILVLDGLIMIRHGAPTLAEWLGKTRLQLTALGITLGYSVLFLGAGQPRNAFELAVLFFPLFIIGFLWQASHNLQRSQERHTFLFETAGKLSTSHTLQSVAEEVLDRLREIIPYDYAAIMVREEPDGGTEVLRLIAGRGERVGRPGARWKTAHGPVWQAVRQGAPLRFEDVNRDKAWVASRRFRKLKAAMLVPILIDGEVRGLIGLGSNFTHAFFPEDKRLVTVLANQLGVAMNNLEIVEQRERLAITEERNRLAREIHDGLAQQLLGIILRMERLDRRGPSVAGELQEELNDVRESMRAALREVRRSIRDLRPEPLQHQSFMPALRRVVEDLGRETGLQVAFEQTGRPFTIPTEVEDGLFQVANEALTNIRKHAGAKSVQMTLRYAPGTLLLTIQDDGKGFELLPALQHATAEGGFGLVGMLERVQGISGRLVIDTKSQQGTRIEVEVPVASARKIPRERVV